VVTVGVVYTTFGLRLSLRCCWGTLTEPIWLLLLYAPSTSIRWRARRTLAPATVRKRPIATREFLLRFPRLGDFDAQVQLVLRTP
jgi:hypothetical protein